jgi:hypothetical protein
MEVSLMYVPYRLAMAGSLLLLLGREASAQQTPPLPQQGPDCTCRVEGRSIAVGATACLRTAEGPRVAECAMVLNNTSWRITTATCPES